MKPILRWFLAGSIAGFLGPPASSARAQSPAGSSERAFVEKCQEENSRHDNSDRPVSADSRSPTRLFRRRPRRGLQTGARRASGQKNPGEEARSAYDQGPQGQADPAPDDSGSNADDDY